MELMVVCGLSNGRSDLSYQTNVASVQVVFDNGSVCGLRLFEQHAQSDTQMTQNIMTTADFFAAGALFAA